MRIRLFSVLMTALACFTLISCDGNDEPNGGSKTELKSIELTNGELVVARQNNQFAWDMFDHLNATQGNTIVSPLSASFAMCMTANGANGATREEIYKAFGFENCDRSDVNSYMQKLSTQLMSLDPKVTMAIANSFWYNKSYNILDSYITSIKTTYDAEVMPLGTNAVDDINNWCSQKTNGNINDLLKDGDVSEVTAFVLVNALFFNGEWKEKFDKKDTFRGAFHSTDGISAVDFMKGKKNLEFAETMTFSMASLDFGNSAYAARFILPKTGNTFEGCIDEIKSIGWEEITKKSTKCETTVNIPKFSLQNQLNMNSIYQQMGIVTAFDPISADFSNISTNHTNIAKAIQGNYFEIDESGATAASVSTNNNIMSNVIPPFTLDRPFIFALTERSTGAILFIGKIEKL